MQLAKGFSTLVGEIYDAALNPGVWNGVLARICEMLDAKAASINVNNPIDGKVSMYLEHGTDPAWTALLMSTYGAMSPIGAAVLVADVDQPIGAFDFVDEDEYVESRFYKEWCAPQGYHDLMGALIAKRPREVGSFATARHVSKGRFDSEHREFVGLIAPHIRRAVTISGLLERRAMETSALASVMQHLAASVLLVDRFGAIVRMNPSAEALCEDGLAAAKKSGRIYLTHAEAQRQLMATLSAGVSEPILIPMTDLAGSGLIVAVLMADARSGLHAVIINRTEDELPPIGKHLAQLFSLTPREVAVLMPLLQGRTIEMVASELGITEMTARTHLKRLMTKTGTSRQVDLVQTVLKAMPPIRL